MISGGVDLKSVCTGRGVPTGQSEACASHVEAEFKNQVKQECKTTYGNQTNSAGVKLSDACVSKFGNSVWDDPISMDPSQVWKSFIRRIQGGFGGYSPLGQFFQSKVDSFKAIAASITTSSPAVPAAAPASAPASTPAALPPPAPGGTAPVAAQPPSAPGERAARVMGSFDAVMAKLTQTKARENLNRWKDICDNAPVNKSGCYDNLEKAMKDLHDRYGAYPYVLDHAVGYPKNSQYTKDYIYEYNLTKSDGSPEALRTLEAVEEFLIRETGQFFKFDDKKAQKNLEALKGLCTSNIINDPEDKVEVDSITCKESLGSVLKQIANQTRGDKVTQEAFFKKAKEPVNGSGLSLKVKVTDADEEPSNTLEEIMSAMIARFGYATKWTGGAALLLLPNAGFGPPKKTIDGFEQTPDNMAGRFPSYPALHFNVGRTFAREPNSTWEAGLDVYGIRGEARGMSRTENEKTGDHWITGPYLRYDHFVKPGVSIFVKLGLHWHRSGFFPIPFTSKGEADPVLQGGDIGMKPVKFMPGVTPSIGVRYQVTRKVAFTAALSVFLACNRENLLPESDLATDPSLKQREVWSCFRTDKDGVPVLGGEIGFIF